MPKSPQDASDGVLCVTVTSNGRPVHEDIQLLAVQIQQGVARIPSARLVVQDGEMPIGRWPAADGGLFKPGAAITVSVGYGDARAVKLVFTGVVVNLGTCIGGTGGSRLEVECRGQAVPMSRQRRHAHFADLTDSQIIARLVGDHSLRATVDATPHMHRGLTQYGCTDWDFIVARARANGLIVIADGDQVRVQAPQVHAAPLLEVQWGTDLLEFQGDVGVSGPERQADTDGVRGRMKFQGSAEAQVGSMIRVSGVGDAYRGDLFVTGVEHTMADGNWFTSVEFQMPVKGGGLRAAEDVAAAVGATAGAPGVQLGTVVQIIGDPEGQQRIQVRLPVLADGQGTVWARVAQWQASNGFGALFMPEVGDEVVVDFFNRDPSQPVVLGSLYSGQRKPAYLLEADNDIKALVTRSRHRLEFDDRNKVITVTTPAGNKVVLNDQDQSIQLHDQHGNRVELQRSGIRLDTPRDLRISAQGAVAIDAVGGVNINSSSDIALTGLTVACAAQTAFSGKGGATAELSADGQTTIKGAMVMIN